MVKSTQPLGVMQWPEALRQSQSSSNSQGRRHQSLSSANYLPFGGFSLRLGSRIVALSSQVAPPRQWPASPRLPLLRDATGVFRLPGGRAWSAAGLDPLLAASSGPVRSLSRSHRRARSRRVVPGHPQRPRHRALGGGLGPLDRARRLRGTARVPALWSP